MLLLFPQRALDKQKFVAPILSDSSLPWHFLDQASDGKRRFWRMSKKYMGSSRKIQRN